MPRPFTEWKVLPHGKLTAIEDDILTVVGDIPMPVGNMKRRMTVVRLRDRRLVIFSAVALDEEEMHALEDFGLHILRMPFENEGERFGHLLNGLVKLSDRNGVDIRPTLLRVVTEVRELRTLCPKCSGTVAVDTAIMANRTRNS